MWWVYKLVPEIVGDDKATWRCGFGEYMVIRRGLEGIFMGVFFAMSVGGNCECGCRLKREHVTEMRKDVRVYKGKHERCVRVVRCVGERKGK